MDLLKVPRFPYQKKVHNKGYLNLAIQVLKCFRPGIFNRVYVTHNKKFRIAEI